MAVTRFVPDLPAKNSVLVRNFPWATVSATSGLAERSSPNAVLCCSGSYFGCSYMSCRSHPANNARPSAGNTARSRLMVHVIHPFGVQAVEKPFRSFRIEFRVFRFDTQEKSVAAGAFETRDVKQRVIRHRQPVQTKHAQHGGDRRAKDRQLKRHGNERGPTVQRPSADIRRIMDDRREPLHEESANTANDPADEGNERDPAPMEAQRFIQA